MEDQSSGSVERQWVERALAEELARDGPDPASEGEGTVKYLGGKERIAGWIRDVVLAHSAHRQVYWEPFVGSGAVFQRLHEHFEYSFASDANRDLVLMWNAAALLGWTPPTSLSLDEYEELKRSPWATPTRSFAGFCCSFGGMWFRDYAATRDDRDHVSQASRSVLETAAHFRRRGGVLLADYRSIVLLDPERTTVYCDPPYHGTEPYKGSAWAASEASPMGRVSGVQTPFDSYEFWLTVGRWSRAGATVLVSEERAPRDWYPVASRTRKLLIGYSTRLGRRVDRDRWEHVFLHESRIDSRVVRDRYEKYLERGGASLAPSIT